MTICNVLSITADSNNSNNISILLDKHSSDGVQACVYVPIDATITFIDNTTVAVEV
jgi:uncharacterized SAM-dependent methyltransferase